MGAEGHLDSEKHYGQTKQEHPVYVTEAHTLMTSPDASDNDHVSGRPDGIGKEICSSNRFTVLKSFVLFHLPSIAVSMTLFALYMVELPWEKSPTPDQLSALQFPAKVHEILIMMSLTELLLHRIKYGLLGKTGIALGFVTAPFHLANPLYLVSADFWGTVLRPQTNPRFHKITVAIIVLLVAIGVTVGPLSAILMIPRENWVETRPTDGFFTQHVFQNPEVFWVERDPYAMELDANYASQASGVCMGQVTDANDDCPDHDVRPLILEFVALNSVAQGGHRAQYNVSVARDGNWTPYRPLSTDLFSTAGFATGAMDFVSYDMSRYGVAGSGDRDNLFRSTPKPTGGIKLKKWKQPIVAVSCATGLYDTADNGTLTFPFNDELLSSLNITMTIAELMSGWTALDMQNNDEGQSFSLSIRDKVPLPVSATVLFTNVVAGEFGNFLLDTVHFEMCHIVSRWHETDVWADTRLPTGAQSELGIQPNKTFEFFKKTTKDDNIVTLTNEWLALIGPLNETTPEVYNTDYAELLRTSRDNSGGTVSYMISKLLALYVTDAMTMSSRFETVAREDADSIEHGPNDIIVETKVYSHLFTYSIHNSRSRPVAFALLFLHMALAVGHHLIISFARKPWHSLGWGSQEELMSLALRSKSPEKVSDMDNIVTSSASRKLPILIRGADGSGQLEMVVAHDIREGGAEAASSGIMTGRGLLRRVQTGLKYN